ncbi:hypothetical protein CBS147320_3483 [Aspergillus niger]|nr:hypothetical protein CBS147320_3483 [Aspergillus niger]
MSGNPSIKLLTCNLQPRSFFARTDPSPSKLRRVALHASSYESFLANIKGKTTCPFTIRYLIKALCYVHEALAATGPSHRF